MNGVHVVTDLCLLDIQGLLTMVMFVSVIMLVAMVVFMMVMAMIMLAVKHSPWVDHGDACEGPL